MEQQQIEETFEDYMRNSRDEFVMAVKNEERSNFLLTSIDSFLVCFDQMREKLNSPLPASSSIEGQKEEWISVKDGLPEFYDMFTKRVLAFDGYVMKVVSLFKTTDNIILGYNTQQECYMRGVTHWRQLPSPPTISKEDEQ